jgi:hypothetical protein
MNSPTSFMKVSAGLILCTGLTLSALKADPQTTTSTLYSADFGTYQDGVLNGNNGWVSTAGVAPGPGYVSAYPGFASNVLSYGGYDGYGVVSSDPTTLPQSQFNYAYHPVSLDTSGGQIVTGLDIKSTFSVTASTRNHPNQDSFGFTLLNSSGDQLVSFDLNPYSASALELGYSTYGALGNNSYTIGSGSQSSDYGLNSFTSLKVGYNGLNNYDVKFTGIGTSAWTLSLSINGISLYSGAINGDFSKVSQDVTAAAFTWFLVDGTQTTSNGVTIDPNYGDNQMVVQNYTLSQLAIPEPKTWVLFGVSALILVVAVRRRAESDQD